MKRFLILSILAAFLAIPAISLADVSSGAGVVPTMTIQLNSVHGSPSAMSVQNFAYTKGALFFNVSSVNNSGGGNADKMQYFRANVSFAGGASSYDKNTGKTTTISNISMNLSGLVISADNKPSAAMGSGSVNGTLTLMDAVGTAPPSLKNMSLKGSYKMNVALGGFDTNGNPTTGTATITVMISRIGPLNLVTTPNFNNTSTILTNQISPQSAVVNLTLGNTPFRVAVSGAAILPPTGTAIVSGTWDGISAKSDLSDGGPMSLTLVQNGTSLTGTLSGGDKAPNAITGFVSGKTVTLQFTDSSGSTATITGVLNADQTLSGTYKATGYAGINPETGKWGAAQSAPGGVTGIWSTNYTSTMSSKSGTDTLLLEQFGSTILGVESSNGNLVAGTISGTATKTLTLSMLDGNGGIIKMTGTVPSSGPATGSYTDYRSGVLDDKGTWTATMQ